MTRLIFACLILALSAGSAGATDPDGRYAQSPLKPWFDSLRSPGGGACCSQSDGKRLEDVDWDSKDGHYRVRLPDVDGKMEWVEVPDDKIINEPNRAGPTMVWPYFVNGHAVVRCFIPGAGM